MVKKHVNHSKALRSGKAQQDTEIRRAKQALSAALTDDVLNDLSSTKHSQNLAKPGTPSARDSAGEITERLAQPGGKSLNGGKLTGPSVRQSQLGAGLVWVLSDNPLTDLARRHVQRIGQLQNTFFGPVDDHCREILTGLARAQLQVASQQVENQTAPFST